MIVKWLNVYPDYVGTMASSEEVVEELSEIGRIFKVKLMINVMNQRITTEIIQTNKDGRK